MVVPQWQGSGSTRAMRLIDGAELIRGDLPASVTDMIPVPLGAGESLDSGVARFSSLVAVRERQRILLQSMAADDVVVTIGGDCGVELAAVEHALSRGKDSGQKVALVWFDAHPDLNGPSSDGNGAFCGMVLRSILGEGAENLTASPDGAISPQRIVLAGTRSIEPAESQYIDEHEITMLRIGDLSEPTALVDAVAATGATRVYVHLDLDVLDPGTVLGIGDPQPFGIDVPTLVQALRAVVGRFPLAGAGIAMYSPGSPDDGDNDMPFILRILSAMTAPERSAA